MKKIMLVGLCVFILSGCVSKRYHDAAMRFEYARGYAEASFECGLKMLENLRARERNAEFYREEAKRDAEKFIKEVLEKNKK